MNSLDDWERCLKTSLEQPVLVFKHSTRCPISAAARNRLVDYLKDAGTGAPPVFEVWVIESRPVSNTVMEDLGISHQSPQVLLVRDRRCVWTVSHHEITGKNIADAVKKHDGSPTPS